PWKTPTLPPASITPSTQQDTRDITAFPSNPSSPQSIGEPLILLVEDDAENRTMLSSYLSAKGYHLAFAQNGQEALEFFQRLRPSIILMDIQMPVMDGLEATQQIRQSLGVTDVPIIALTALAMKGDQKRCLDAGANEYLSKPVKLKHLETLLQRYLSYG
ncbi:MAG: response regulator, partial [Okeania sp. SIO2H7]|nr:response regulator [Okeania sp. SIO2H7]